MLLMTKIVIKYFVKIYLEKIKKNIININKIRINKLFCIIVSN